MEKLNKIVHVYFNYKKGGSELVAIFYSRDVFNFCISNLRTDAKIKGAKITFKTTTIKTKESKMNLLV